ncbi:hypothetical protein A9Q99_27465 [Gammaproteobacteria bacterium 45_16_T64]|nr:hypothetical protein A9Q99_27465 [Gammaproteobacteria bacterium 45_16_T64]
MLDLIKQSFDSPLNGWSIGSFGAIGEFMWDANEERCAPDGDRFGCITERGAMAVTLREDIQPVAYEYLTKDPRHWNQGVAFCLEADKAMMSNHPVVTELGPDHGALKVEHRDHIMFDMGLQRGFVDVAIRTNDKALITLLRLACGSDLLAPGNPAMGAIIKTGPHRVFTTALGRLEVYQSIGIEKSPEGPHTHVLPKLMASGRAFSANIPIPDRMLPMFTLHAANPCKDLLGKGKAFDERQFHTYQQWLKRFSVGGFYQQKQGVFGWLDADTLPSDIALSENRLLRTAVRVAIRQYEYLHPEKQSLLKEWRHRFDKLVDDVSGEKDKVNL